MTFRYARYSSEILRPVIPIALHHNGNILYYEVLIDSGADVNIFGYQAGEYLGLDVEAGRAANMIGATGEPQTFYIHSVVLSVGGKTFEVQAGFARSVEGFFDLFKVTFDLANEKLQLAQNE